MNPLSLAFNILNHMRYALLTGLGPTVKDIFKNPSLLLNPKRLSQLYMAHLWLVMGDRPDETQEGLVTPHAHGTVLDVGAGHGTVIRYLDRTRVTRYIALEPNRLMHPSIRAEANKLGFHESDGTLAILGCGAEDTNTILHSIKELSSPTGPNASTAMQVDTLISIRTLCSVPNAQHAMEKLVRFALKPGGQFLMYEHVLNHRGDVAWWQRFWAPFWAVCFDGCRLDRDTDVWVRGMMLDSAHTGNGGDHEQVSAWKEVRMWGMEGEEEDSMLWHSVGRFVKA